MMADEVTFWVAGCSHHQTALGEREQLVIPPECLAGAPAAALREALGGGELMILATCNRVEFYGTGPLPSLEPADHRFRALAEPDSGDSAENGKADDPARNARESPVDPRVAAVAEALQKQLPSDFSCQLFAQQGYFYQNEAAVRHLFAVAAGLDSQLLGETEITGQVKAAYQRATDAGIVGPTLHRLLQKALQSAKWVRSETAIGRGQVSLGNIAAELAERACGNLADVSVLLVGTGEIGRGITQALVSRGARRLTITGRNAIRARAVAEQFAGAPILPFTHRDRAVAYSDVVIACTGAPEAVLGAAMLRRAFAERPHRPLFLIDLAMPRDIEPDPHAPEGIYRYNLDDLARIANRNLASRQADVTRARNGLQERALRAWQSLNHRQT